MSEFAAGRRTLDAANARRRQVPWARGDRKISTDTVDKARDYLLASAGGTRHGAAFAVLLTA
jgi:hypothetical protein